MNRLTTKQVKLTLTLTLGSQSAYLNTEPNTSSMKKYGNSVMNDNSYSHVLPGQGQSSTPSNNQNYSSQQEDRGVDELIKVFRKCAFKRGGNAIFQIGKHFCLYDKNKNKTLDMDEWKRIVREYGTGMTPSEVESLFIAFDYDGVGTINYEEFLRILRGPMNDRRKTAVIKLFERLDKHGDGHIDIHDIKQIFNASKHPDAEKHQKSPDQVYYEFIESINTYTQTMKGGSNKDKISLDEWLEYYNNISASIDKDDYFLHMLNNCWNRTQR